MAFVTPKTASDPSSSSSSALARWEYDVFLSFRGEDTRKNFTDHLYAALDQRGIRTFRDDEKLEKGKPISPKLLNAIQVSRFAVIVLSRNYASSSWCLDELVKIVECTEETGLIALPVFYHVNPSDVRKQKGTFAEAFAEHEGHIKNKEKVQTWKYALTQVANLSGWDLQDEQESTIIEEIVGKILSELNSTYSSFHQDLVGINSRVEEMKNLYSGTGLNDVRFIGIWGMGGIEALAGDRGWFGRGSIIIITTRDQHLLIRNEVTEEEIYKAKKLNDDEALKLFSRKAFKQDYPAEGYEVLSKKVIYYAKGLPLALEVLGSFLFHRKPDAWESALEPGQRSRLWCSEHVLHVLKHSTGTEKVESISLSSPSKGEEHLNVEAFSKMKNLRLLKISNVQLPHGLNYLSNELRFLNWDGYPLESMPTSFQPYKLVELIMPHSRIKQLWDGIGSSEWLKLINLSNSKNLIMTPDFTRVPNLEILILKGCTRMSKIHASLGDLKRLILLDLNGCIGLKSLPYKISLESLEIFVLSGCSRLKKFPEIVGNMLRLSKLYLDGTAIKELPLSVERLTGLTLLNLRDCKNFSSLPSEHLGNVEGLEELDVSRTAIRELPSSIVHLKNLTALSLRGCEGLSSKSSNKLLPFPSIPSPDTMSLIWPSLSVLCSLTKLDLSYCNLQAISKDIGLNCTSLRLLPELPLNIGFVVANGCSKLEALPDPLELKFGFKPMFDLLNCFKLVENQGYGDMFLTMLRSYHQSSVMDFGIVIPGSKIPKWYSHQSVGTSVNLQVPSYLCNKMGITFCAVFVLHQHHPPDQLDDLYPRETLIKLRICLGGTFSANGHDCQTSTVFPFNEDSGKVESHHLWLYYLPPKFFKMNWNKGWDTISANGFSQIGIKFYTRGPGLEVKKCGIGVVYEQDIEDISQTNELEFFTVDDCNNFVVAVEGSEIESSHVDHDRDGPSGEHRSNETQHRNIIDRLMLCLGIWIENFCTR
uniref:TIR domain-containing protein n=1 Tax=Fagus sylvatica TaxID=28930 RepID=A0A2N9FND5_FAGSY